MKPGRLIIAFNYYLKLSWLLKISACFSFAICWIYVWILKNLFVNFVSGVLRWQISIFPRRQNSPRDDWINFVYFDVNTKSQYKWNRRISNIWITMEEQVSAINIRTPKKVLHFSDGILEIFDDDEEKKLQAEAQEPEVDEVSLLIERTISYKSCLIVVSKWVLDES